MTAADITALVDLGERETRSLDFKLTVYNTGVAKEKQELLADITAFANTAGGDLVIGVLEREEVAVDAPGVGVGEATALHTKLAAVLASNTDPPLRGVDSRVVPFGSERAFLVIRVPASDAAPHRELEGKYFYERTPTGKTKMDTDALRSAFLRHELVLGAFDDFRRERLERMVATGRWVGADAPVIGLQAAPLHALSRRSRRYVDFAELKPRNWKNLELRGDEEVQSYTAEGFARWYEAYGDWGGHGFFVHHDGRYEAYCGGKRKQGNAPAALFERVIIQRLSDSWAHLLALDVHLGITPLLVGVCAYQLDNSALVFEGTSRSSMSVHGIEPVYGHEVRIDRLPEKPEEFGALLRASLTPIFGAFNQPRSTLNLAHDAWRLDR